MSFVLAEGVSGVLMPSGAVMPRLSRSGLQNEAVQSVLPYVPAPDGSQAMAISGVRATQPPTVTPRGNRLKNPRLLSCQRSKEFEEQMASDTTVTGALDLNNEIHFPAYEELPYEHDLDTRYYSEEGSLKAHWCFLAEIKETIPWIRPYYNVRDKTGSEYLVSFHLEDRSRFPVIWEQCKDGYTMCIMYANQHIFADGQIGVRVEEESTVKILPCRLQEVFEVGQKLMDMKHTGLCNVCGQTATLRCSKCQLFYCNKKCQMKDWKGGHKEECKVVQQIRAWQAFDWNVFGGFRLFKIF